MNTQTNASDSGVRTPGTASTANRYAGGNGDSPSVAGEFRNFITDVEEMVKATTSMTGDDLARAKAKLAARIVSAKASAEDMGIAIADRARKAAKATDGYVQENPWKAVGAGAALGVLIGFLIARR